MNTPEGNYTFIKADRDRIKERSMLPTETLRYIEALEAIAKAACDVWRCTPHYSKPTALTVDALNAMYDKLSVVHFMDEDL